MGVATGWKRILKWYGANTPEGTLSMRPGATREQIAELEAWVGQKLPADFRESYSRYNGSDGWILHYGSLRSLTEIATEWQMFQKGHEEGWFGSPTQLESPKIRPLWWTPLRLPITDNGGGDPVMLDLDPAPSGSRGVIKFNHEVGPINVLGPSMSGWLDRIAEQLEAGVHAYSEDSLMVCPVAWGRS
ncbi:MAG: glucan biosynthesis protein [Isosphaera sp.]|nr:glucan biosynthesis protein [Isosphaera sp.]